MEELSIPIFKASLNAKKKKNSDFIQAKWA